MADAEAVSRIEEEHEAIDEVMEDLLIFPSEDILRRALKIIESHFASEETFMKQCKFGEEDLDSQIEDQQRILSMARTALKGGSMTAASCCTSS
mmetsp:Transcript_46048/g.139767  ORF Transcript_46048/g.139767 Transcript_46048/m.139767 type:complete len:94 (-) Transcript_46048:662-943(-)